MGSTKLWFPSRRSVESQRGGLSIVLEGHCLFASWRGLKAVYFFEGSLSLCSQSSDLSFCRAEGGGFPHGHLDDGGVEAIEKFIRSLSNFYLPLLALGAN